MFSHIRSYRYGTLECSYLSLLGGEGRALPTLAKSILSKLWARIDERERSFPPLFSFPSKVVYRDPFGLTDEDVI